MVGDHIIGKNKPFFVGTLENYPSGGIRSREPIDLRRDVNLNVLKFNLPCYGL